MIVPNTDVILLKVPLEMDDLNQLTFASKQAQFNYFNGLPKLALDDFTYQRKDNIIRVPELYDDILQYNYVMYRNTNYSDKWFYAFIEDMEYLNDNVTAVKIRTDTWQCWQFDLTYKHTFVQREHTNDDTIGANTQPETLDIGEPIVNDSVLNLSPAPSGYYICFMVSDRYNLPLSMQDISSQFNGIFSGYTFFGVDGASQANDVIKAFVADNRGTAINNIFLVPKSLFGTPVEYRGESFTFPLLQPQQNLVPTSIIDEYSVTRVNTLDGYTPKNNKLYTAPFSYIILSNNVGGNAEYHYEDFTNAVPKFRLSGIISSGCDIKMTPLAYKRVSGKNDIYGLKMGKLPVCSWNTDSYAVWLAQNQLNMRVSLTRNTLKTVAGVATKNPELIGGGIGSYAGDVLNSMSERYLAEHTPDEVHGDVNSSDFNFSSSLFFSIRRMSIRAEYARNIDDYFSALGYATNRVKLPNITGRRNWNYIKTIGCYIEADIPQKDLQEIKSMFDRGITLWHNPATFADYSQNNDII